MFGRKAIYLGSEVLISYLHQPLLLLLHSNSIYRMPQNLTLFTLQKKRKLVVFLLFFCCTWDNLASRRVFLFHHLRSHVFHAQKELETSLVSSLFFGSLDNSICTCLVVRLYKVSLASIFVQNRSYLLTFTIFAFTITLVVYLTTPNLAFFHAQKKSGRLSCFFFSFVHLR